MHCLAERHQKIKIILRCLALGIWVGFFKQPALPGKAPPKKFLKKILKKNFINKKSQMNQK
jgi:hypothetical protein